MINVQCELSIRGSGADHSLHEDTLIEHSTGRPVLYIA